jgi:GNAT superfamily N-acetyltransferase
MQLSTSKRLRLGKNPVFIYDRHMNHNIKSPIEIATTDSDREKCKALINKFFPESQSVLSKGYHLISHENCTKELLREDRELFMLHDPISKNLIGTVLLTLGEKRQSFACIQYLITHPNFRNLGHGRCLLEHAENRAIQHGKKEIYISVVYHPKFPAEADELVKFYTKRGYEEKRELERSPNPEESVGFATEYRNDVRMKWLRKSLANN